MDSVTILITSASNRNHASDGETLELWGDEEGPLGRMYTKKHVHEKLAAGMTEAEYEGRGVECGAGTRLPEEEIH